MFIRVKVREIPCQKNAPTLSSCLWFRNESLSIYDFSLSVFWLVWKLSLEFSKFCRKQIGLWKKIIFLWVMLEHSLQVPCKIIFTSKGIHTWKMIDSLVRLHPIKFIDLNETISPKNIPFIFWVIVFRMIGCFAKSHLIKRSRYISHNMVLSIWNIQNKLLCLEFSFLLALWLESFLIMALSICTKLLG